jgi:hypothetical protein
MIDYEKLKLAHSLAQNYYENTGNTVVIEWSLSFGCHKYSHKLWINSIKYDHSSVAEIIQKLQELTQKKPKYDIGETVWFKDCDDKIDSMTITKIKHEPSTVVYFDENKGWCVHEKDLLEPQKFVILPTD